jgi:hypothetical protein
MLLELLYMKLMKILPAVFKLLYAGRDRDRHGKANKQIINFFFVNVPKLVEMQHHKN